MTTDSPNDRQPIQADSPLGLAVQRLQWEAELHTLPRIIRLEEVPAGGVVIVNGDKWPDGLNRILIDPDRELDPGDWAAYGYVDGEQS